MKRIHILDTIRGLTIISMVLFHLFYNINYYHRLDFYDGTVFNRCWQLSIAISFFVISGITSNFLSKNKNIKRGIYISIIGFSISLFTFLFAKDQLILWGVLNGIGLSIIFGEFLKKYIKIYHWPILMIFFVLTYKIPAGNLYSISFFKSLYDKNIFPLGFPSQIFSSTDYFPLIPWIFPYLAGISLGKYLIKRDFFSYRGKENLISKIGRHSMTIYLAHQIILYPLVSFIFK